MREEDDEDEHVVEVRLLGVEAEHLIVVEKLVIEDRTLAGVAHKLVGDAHKLVGVAHKPEDDAHKLVEGDRKQVEVEVQNSIKTILLMPMRAIASSNAGAANLFVNISPRWSDISS